MSMSLVRSLLLTSSKRAAVAPLFLLRPSALHLNKPSQWVQFAIPSRSYAQVNKRQEITQRIIQLIRDFDKVTSDRVTEDSHFTTDLGLDSLDTVEVVMAIEEEFSIEIPDKEADAILTVKQAIDYIASRSDAE